jgi:hypothetical protein
MKQFSLAAVMLAATLAAAGPAAAQLSAGGGEPAPTPHGPAPDVAPPAIPGEADSQSLATGASLQTPAVTNPTTALFDAINNGDYDAAQDAISRGADENARNPLGETPLDLSIALNRNTITFMLLSARNEGGQTPPSARPLPSAPIATAPTLSPTPARLLPQSHFTAGTSAAVQPDPNAGFLGFSGK